MENTKQKHLELISTFLVPSLLKLYKKINKKIPAYSLGSKTPKTAPYLILEQTNREISRTKDNIHRMDYFIDFTFYGNTEADCILSYIQIIDFFNKKQLFEKEDLLFFDDTFLLHNVRQAEEQPFNLEQIENKNLVKLDFTLIFTLIPN